MPISLVEKSVAHADFSCTQEKNQKLVVLKEDDPDAMEWLTRHLYGFPMPPAREHSWRFWFNLVVVADKYLAEVLISAAEMRLIESAEMQSSANDAWDIIQDIKTSLSHHQVLVKLQERLRKKHLKGLLKNERYRDHITSNRELMLAQLDELEVPSELSPKLYSVCRACEKKVFRPLTDSLTKNCVACTAPRGGVLGRVAYLPKE